jgi:hypothetical protein
LLEPTVDNDSCSRLILDLVKDFLGWSSWLSSYLFTITEISKVQCMRNLIEVDYE